MSQAELGDFVPAETSGVELAVLMKASENAIHSTHSGVSRPSYAVAGTMWVDTATTPWRLKIYSGTEDYDLGPIAANAFGELVGRVSDYAGVDLPSGYLWCDGAAVSRETYATLYGVLTKSVTGTTTSSSTTISSVSADLRNYGLVGADIEGSGIPAGTTITAIGASSITLSQAATASATVSLRIFPHGNGNGSTTFNVPDLRGRVAAGRDDMGGSAASVLTAAVTFDGTVLGLAGGAQGVTLTEAQIAAHDHTASASGTAQSNGAHTHTVTGTFSGTAASGGSHTHSVDIGWGAQNAYASIWGAGGFVDGNSSAIQAGGAHTHTVSGTISGTAASNGAHTHTLSVSVTVDNAGGGEAHANVQPTMIINKIIKT